MNKVILVFAFSFSMNVKAQSDRLGFFEPSPVYNQKRMNQVVYATAGLYPLSMYWLYTQWYRDFPQSAFHFFNDESEWLQMDKAGHVFSSYTISKAGMRAMEWTGLNPNRSAWYGAGLGFAFVTAIEVFDGFSTQWGFSTTDIAANGLGTAIFISQQLGWHEQRVTLKYSFHQSDYSQYRPGTLGSDIASTNFKDYNGQTYWLCVNPYLFLGDNTKFPRWLGISLGYGAEGMLGGHTNPALVNGNAVPEFDRYRQYYLSVDFDLSKIRTRSKLLAGVFKTINFIKLPAPAIEFNNNHKTKFYAFYF